MDYIYRNLTQHLRKSIETRPLTYLSGARQVGKSTLCANLFDKQNVNHISFDSPFLLTAAKSDPATFVTSLPTDRINIIDEVQFAPEIFPYLKIAVDKNRLESINQKFLLTGSANLLALPSLSQALVGRMSVLTLYPFAASEYLKTQTSIIDKLFRTDLSIQSYPSLDIVELIANCTYPEIATDATIDRTKWFDDYLTTLLNRDIKSLSDLKKPENMIKLLAVLSMRTAGLLNNTEIAREIGIDYKTYEKLFAFGINSYLFFTLSPWTKINKLNKRFVKSPKLYFTDCNFLAYILRRNLHTLCADKTVFGHILENFIASELIKEAKINNIEVTHFRTQAGKEVDFVLENHAGEIVGIEVKSSYSINKRSITGLNELQSICGDAFKQGLVIYTGQEIVPLASNIWAVPINYLFQ